MSWLAAVLAVFAQCWRGWRFVEEATDMLGGSKGAVESTASQESVVSANPDIIIESADLLPGDVLLYRPRTANLIQSKIMRVTGSPYTHAAIYLGDGNIAESVIPRGVTKNALKKSIDGTQRVAILRSQLGFVGERAAKLTEFVNSVIENQNFYDFISAICFERKSKAYFDRQLEFIKENYGKISSDEEYSKMKFFVRLSWLPVAQSSGSLAKQPKSHTFLIISPPGTWGRTQHSVGFWAIWSRRTARCQATIRSFAKQRFGVIAKTLVGGEACA